MRHLTDDDTQCPIARSLDRVGEWWNILILREAFLGAARFEHFQRGLPIAPNILSRRLGDLVAAGLFERRPYQKRPLRWEYVLTERGRDFRPVLLALMAWGNRHFASEGRSVVLLDTATGREADPVMVDGHTGRPITLPEFRAGAGPAANERTRLRYAERDAGGRPADAFHPF